MPKPGEKSKSKRTTYRKGPASTTIKRYKGKTKSKPKCAKCGAELHGIPKNASKLSKSEKTVNRPYGGHYCSKCMREKILDISVDE